MGSVSCPHCGDDRSVTGKVEWINGRPHATPGGISGVENTTCGNCGREFSYKAV